MLSLFPFISLVSAEDSDDTIIVEDKKEDSDQLGSISIIKIDQALQQADLGEILSQQPSITIRRFGGLSPQHFLSEGSSDQTTIMINGVPLNPEGSSAINLSDLPIQTFSN